MTYAMQLRWSGGQMFQADVTQVLTEKSRQPTAMWHTTLAASSQSALSDW